jgi:hypothetical protein
MKGDVGNSHGKSIIEIIRARNRRPRRLAADWRGPCHHRRFRNRSGRACDVDRSSSVKIWERRLVLDYVVYAPLGALLFHSVWRRSLIGRFISDGRSVRLTGGHSATCAHWGQPVERTVRVVPGDVLSMVLDSPMLPMLNGKSEKVSSASRSLFRHFRRSPVFHQAAFSTIALRCHCLNTGAPPIWP